MGDTIVITTNTPTVLEVSGKQGPQGPAGATGATGATGPQGPAGTGIETLTTAGDLLYRDNSAAARLAIGSAGQVLKVSNGLPAWANESGAVSSVNGQTGAVTLASVDIASDQVLQISEAGDVNCNGVFIYGGDYNGYPTYYKSKDTFVYWDSGWNISHNSDDKYVGTSTARPWQAVWSLGSATGDLPVVEQLNSQEYEKSVGERTNPTAFGTASGKNVGTGANDVAAGNHTHSSATTTVAGFLSASDKTKLDGIASGATANTASSATPAALGTSAAGSSSDYSRSDHIHSAEVSDAAFRVFGSADSTKKIAIEVDLLTTATTRTLTVPDKNITLDDQDDPRDPTAHAASHAAAGSDPVFDQDLNTTDNAEFAQVGFGGDFTIDAAGLNWSGQLIFEAETNTFYDQVGNTAFIVGSVCEFTKDVKLLNTADTTASVELNADAITTGQSRVISLPDASGTLALVGDAPTAHALASASHTAGNHKVFYSDGSGQIQELALGSNGTVLTSNGATSAPSFAAASGGVGGSTGSTDNALLRADGTGGATAQASDLVIDDAVVAYAVTGNASTDIITAVGHNFTNNQGVRFPTLTGGSGLTAATTNYFVRDISGDTFKISATSGGAAVNFTTNITAGTVIAMQANVAVRNTSSETNSALVLTPKGNGAFMLGAQPDGSLGGNARGIQSVDLQLSRSTAAQVASGDYSFVAGRGSTASVSDSIAMGLNSTASAFVGVAIGRNNTASSADYATCIGGAFNTASAQSAICIGGQSTAASAPMSSAIGQASVADRRGMFAHANNTFAANGDAQRARFVLRCKTTTNAAVEMALDGSTTYLTIPSGKVIFCNIKVVGVKSDGSTVATYERQYAAKNVAGTSSEVYAAVTIGTDNAASTSLEIATVDAGDYIRIRPTGIASETWRWVASVDAVEVAYGT